MSRIVEGKMFTIGAVDDLPPVSRRTASPRHYPELTAFAELAPGETLLIPCESYTMRDTQTFWAQKFRAVAAKVGKTSRSRFDHGWNGVRFWMESK